ncbi:MAG: MFS transporter [Acidobacteriaceae bacterium]|nr:MFS transporter [Acidobacteriaceae bacterium]
MNTGIANTMGRGTPTFFPADLPPWVREAHTFGIFAACYVARPVGGQFIGQLSDRIGRKTTFTLSVLLMAVPTLLIACLPTYHTIGAMAPLLLLLLRLGQGAAIGGETPRSGFTPPQPTLPGSTRSRSLVQHAGNGLLGFGYADNGAVLRHPAGPGWTLRGAGGRTARIDA